MKGSASERILTLVCAGVVLIPSCMACRDDFKLVLRNGVVLLSFTDFEIVLVEILHGKVSLELGNMRDFERGEERGRVLATNISPSLPTSSNSSN